MDSKEEKLIREHAGLVKSVALRLSYACEEELDDIIQIGYIGLLKAARRFEPERGLKFSTYAVPKIAGEIRRFLRDDGPVKVGRTLRERGQSIWSARQRLRTSLGREPRLSELAAETGWNAEEIATAELATSTPDSLQQETAEGLTLESTLGTEAPEEALVEKIALREAIRALPEREQETIFLRFFKCMTQEQAARILGVSQVQVSRLERKGVAHLREMLRD